MNELVVLSGKGGTGKTSMTAAFAVFSGRDVIADCDVDAANLHLLLSPATIREEDYFGGYEASINVEDCSTCGLCASLCRFGAVHEVDGWYGIERCEGCGVCVRFCPNGAIEWTRALTGRWMVADSRAGRMVHARLRPGAENSGKLVSRVREVAREEVAKIGADRILVDGPPGIGCPAIASLTGAKRALVVTEPTPSGLHDMVRVLELARQFGVETRVLVNKSDLNPALGERIRAVAAEHCCADAGDLPYDLLFTRSQMAGLPLPLFAPEADLTRRLRRIWGSLDEWSHA